MTIQDSIKKLLGFVESAKGIELKLDQVEAAIKEAKSAGYEEGFLFSDKRNIETIKKINEQLEALKAQIKDPVNVEAIKKSAFEQGVASVVVPDISKELEAAKTEADKLGFDRGVASVVLPEVPDVKSLTEAAFAEGVASVVIPADRTEEVEALKSELDKIKLELDVALQKLIDQAAEQESKIQAALEIEKQSFDLAFAEIKQRLADEQAGKAQAEELAKGIESQLAESLDKLSKSQSEIDALLASVDAINLKVEELNSLNASQALAIQAEKDLAIELKKSLEASNLAIEENKKQAELLSGQLSDLDAQNDDLELQLIKSADELAAKNLEIEALKTKILELEKPVEPAPVVEPIIETPAEPVVEEPAPIVEPTPEIPNEPELVVEEPVAEETPADEPAPVVEEPLVEPEPIVEVPAVDIPVDAEPVVDPAPVVDEAKPTE